MRSKGNRGHSVSTDKKMPRNGTLQIDTKPLLRIGCVVHSWFFVFVFDVLQFIELSINQAITFKLMYPSKALVIPSFCHERSLAIINIALNH